MTLEVGRYVLHGELGTGGMATVYYGRLHAAAGFSRTVAIKRLHPHLAREPELVGMLLDEARLAARVRHPNVVAILDLVTTGTEVLLVLEYVHGAPLSELLKATALDPPPRRIACAVIHGVLLGLDAAHNARNEQGRPLNIVHRDVSPQNVLIGLDGVARVTDFGIAKASERSQTTRDGQLKGKLAYMSPEQLLNQPVDARSDVYSAAVLLWETLTARRLFQSSSGPGSLTQMILTAEVPPPSQFVPDVSAELDRVVMQGLARDPSQRFASARQMADALEAVMPLVSASRVAEWVESLAGANLDRRQAELLSIETLPPRSAPSSAQATPARASEESNIAIDVDRTPDRRRRGQLAVALLGLGLVAGSSFWYATRVLRPDAPAATTAVSAANVAAPAVLPAPAPIEETDHPSDAGLPSQQARDAQTESPKTRRPVRRQKQQPWSQDSLLESRK